MENWQSAGKDFIYLLGVYFGDGSITPRTQNSYQFAFESIDIDFVNQVLKCIKKLTNKKPNVSTRQRGVNRNPTYYFSTCNELYKYMYNITSGKKIIPDFIINGDKETKQIFLTGCLDSDGWVSRHHAKNGLKQFSMGYCKGSSYINEIYRLMCDIGLQVGLPKAKQSKSNNVYWTICINMQSWVKSGMRFNIERKNKRVEEYKLKWSKPQRLYARQD